MSGTLPYHRELRALLKDHADLSVTLGPTELPALWFDTYYWPCQSYVSSVAQRAWASCFTQAELMALARFHSEYQAQRAHLPGWERDWRIDPAWQTVSRAAKDALLQFNPDA